MTNLVHKSVMLSECLEGLNLKDNGVYFDGTFGGGGHSGEILKRTSPNGRLIATDLDDYAIARGQEKLIEYKDRFTLIKDNFKNFKQIKQDLGISGFDGILLDLGVSSFQLDDRSRGFSYMASDELLDMRMNKSQYLTAEKIVNEYSEKDLKRILFDYGEEKFTNQIVKNILAQRKIKKIQTVKELNEIIDKSIPFKAKQNGHPSKKTFQALRIEVNGELEGLYQTIIDMVRGLNENGRIVILTFHSLEDRIVKRAFKELELDCICDKSLPVCVCGKKKEIEIITKHPILATEEELINNSRSKSAKLRIAQKI